MKKIGYFFELSILSLAGGLMLAIAFLFLFVTFCALGETGNNIALESVEEISAIINAFPFYWLVLSVAFGLFYHDIKKDRRSNC